MEWGLVIIWWVACLALYAVGLPLAAVVFTSDSTRGAGFALPIALCVLGVVAYLVGHLSFGLSTLLAALAALAVLSAVAVIAGGRPHRHATVEHWLVFTAAFGFIVAVQAYEPGILPSHEHFLDYGLLRSILRADALPPEAVWFAGEHVRYYYGGHMLAALLIRLTATPPQFGYNLALATFYGLLLTATYALAGAIADASSTHRRTAATFAVFFTGFASNLLTPMQAVLDILPNSIATPLTDRLAASVHRVAGNQLNGGLDAFHYQDASLVIPDTINQFPLFAWIHAELHAHMMSMPFLLLAAGLLHEYYRLPEQLVQRRAELMFAAVPFVAGFITVANSWTTPVVVGLTWLAVSFAPANPSTLLPPALRTPLRTVTSEVSRPIAATLVTAATTAVTVVVAAPFLFLATGGGQESLATVSPTQRSSLIALLLVHGGFLLVFVPYLAARIRSSATLTRQNVGVAAVSSIAIVAFGQEIAAPAVLLFLPLLLLAWYVLGSDTDVGFETVLLVAGLGLVLAVEFWYVFNQEYVIPHRGNTVFKTYSNVWVLWSVAAGAMIPGFLADHKSAFAVTSRRLGTVFVVLLVATTSIYGVIAVDNHFDRAFEPPEHPHERAGYVYYADIAQSGAGAPSDPPTLDGMLYADVMHPQEADAIRWLDRTVNGQPTLVSAPGGRWTWASPASSLTGIPTVAGWAHELVYRDWDDYYARTEDVRTIYRGTPENRAALLVEYEVDYIYVGPMENSRYDIRPFTELDGVTVAYQNDEVTIYAVDRRQLARSDEAQASVSVQTPVQKYGVR